MATDNIALVRRYIEEVWNKGNLDVLSELIADKYVAVEPLLGEIKGVDALRKQVQSYRTAFPDLRMSIEDMGMSGDRVFVRWIGRGSHKGMFIGVSPTNNRGEIRGISLYRLMNGKIVEDQAVFDSLALFQILGVVPPLDRLMKGQMPSAEQRRV
jgi:steroid delta-isomerase-like uncharacterized protein